MTNKNEAQIFLEGYEKYSAIIPNKLIEIQQWDDLATSITAAMNGVCVQSSGSKQKMADAVDKCLDIIDELSSQVEFLRAKQKEVTQTIEKLDTPYFYKILHLKYIQFNTHEEIAEKLGQSYTSVTTAHGRALIAVGEILRSRQ